MQQRRLRLGDILDDYCPRERRVTNHVIVAMIEDEVRQTRCSTCSADHDYKEAKVPVLRRTKPAGAIFADAPETASQLRPAVAVPLPSDSEASEPLPAAMEEPATQSSPLAADSEPEPDDDGPVHRRLIRATLPRPEGHVPERKAPEFTVRQPGAPGRGQDIDGNRPGRGPQRGPQRGPFGGGGGQSRFGGGPRHDGGGGSGQGGPRHGGGRHGNGSGQPGQPGQPGQRQGSGRGRRRGGR